MEERLWQENYNHFRISSIYTNMATHIYIEKKYIIFKKYYLDVFTVKHFIIENFDLFFKMIAFSFQYFNNGGSFSF